MTSSSNASASSSPRSARRKTTPPALVSRWAREAYPDTPLVSGSPLTRWKTCAAFGPAAPAGSRGAMLQPVVDRYAKLLEQAARRWPRRFGRETTGPCC